MPKQKWLTAEFLSRNLNKSVLYLFIYLLYRIWISLIFSSFHAVNYENSISFQQKLDAALSLKDKDSENNCIFVDS